MRWMTSFLLIRRIISDRVLACSSLASSIFRWAPLKVEEEVLSSSLTTFIICQRERERSEKKKKNVYLLNFQDARNSQKDERATVFKKKKKKPLSDKQGHQPPGTSFNSILLTFKSLSRSFNLLK